MKKVAILLVLYNDLVHLPRLIASINDQSYKLFDIYAIETSESGDSSRLLKELYPKVKIFPYNGNLGFAAGNNFLAERANSDGADFFFVLNADMELSGNTIEVFLSYFNLDQKIGVVGSALMIGDSDRLQLFGAEANFKSQKKILLYSNNSINSIKLPNELEVDFVNGGSTFLSKVVYEKTGLFNEGYFMYNDEIEFAFKVKKAGLKTIVTSKTLIKHHHNWTNENNNYYFMYYYILRNRYLYFQSHKLYIPLFKDILMQFFLLPIKLNWALKIADLRLIKFYYLGILHGILNKTGKSNVRFE